MPSAVQLAGRLQQKLGRLVALDGERGSAVSARAATFSALDALEGALERQPAGPFSAELSSALQRLVDPLLALVAQHRAAGDDPPNLLWAADAAASVLFTLLCCVDSRRLVLNDADALRLLSAAPVVLRVQPQMLRMFAESFRSGDLRAQDLSEDLHPCRMMETNVQAVSLLVSALTEPEPPLPERALAAAQATSLRPQALKDWLCGPGSVLDTIAAFLFVVVTVACWRWQEQAPGPWGRPLPSA